MQVSVVAVVVTIAYKYKVSEQTCYQLNLMLFTAVHEYDHLRYCGVLIKALINWQISGNVTATIPGYS
jgi:hypothetical protein